VVIRMLSSVNQPLPKIASRKRSGHGDRLNELRAGANHCQYARRGGHSKKLVIRKAKVTHPSDNHMVQNRKVQRAAHFHQRSGQMLVGFTGAGIARGMIVHQNKRRSPHNKGLGKDNLWINDSPGLAPNGNLQVPQCRIGTVERQRPKLLLRAVNEPGAKTANDVLGSGDPNHGILRTPHSAAAQLHGPRDSNCTRRTNASDAHQSPNAASAQGMQIAIKFFEKPTPGIHSLLAPGSTSDEQRQQLSIPEGVYALQKRPLSGPQLPHGHADRRMFGKQKGTLERPFFKVVLTAMRPKSSRLLRCHVPHKRTFEIARFVFVDDVLLGQTVNQ